MLLLPGLAAAGDVRRSVDAQDVTRLSDPAPARFQAGAALFQAYRSPIRSGAQLVADDRSSSGEARDAPPRKTHPRLPADFGVLEYPPLGNTAYDEKLRRYYESQACFARFRNANGSVKPEAYDYCKEVPFPTRE